MPAQPRDARLRIPSFTPPTHAAVGDLAKDIIFILRAVTVRRAVSDSVIAFPLARWRGGVITPINIIRHVITVSGSLDEPGHTAHPVSTATEHDPDMIDFEEAVITWSGNVPTEFAHLELDFNGQSWRVYQGVILKAVLTRQGGHTETLFDLTFGVLFDPALPGLREWS